MIHNINDVYLLILQITLTAIRIIYVWSRLWILTAVSAFVHCHWRGSECRLKRLANYIFYSDWCQSNLKFHLLVSTFFYNTVILICIPVYLLHSSKFNSQQFLCHTSFSSVPCEENQFRCPGDDFGPCFPLILVCDDVIDCPDRFDEENCSSSENSFLRHYCGSCLGVLKFHEAGRHILTFSISKHVTFTLSHWLPTCSCKWHEANTLIRAY